MKLVEHKLHRIFPILKLKDKANIVDGIIPKKKSLNSSKNTPHNTESAQKRRSALLNLRADIISSQKTQILQRVEFFNTFLEHGKPQMKAWQDYQYSTLMRMYEQLSNT